MQQRFITVCSASAILLLLVSFCSFFTANGQTLVIGAGAMTGTATNGATGDSGPIYRSTGASAFIYSRHHYYYSATELAGLPVGSLITHLAWNKDNGAASNSACNFEIWCKNSALTQVPAAPQTWATLTTGAGATQVYTGLTNVPAAIGWFTIALQTPFIYTGGALEISVAYDHSTGTNPWSTLGYSWKRDNISNRTISYCGNSNSTTLNNNRTVRPQLQITYTAGTPCTNPPTPGDATADRNNVCPGTAVALDLTGNSSGNGQNYQWQSSPDNITYTNLGASSLLPSRTVNPAATTWYRCQVTCNAGTPVYSTPIEVVTNSPVITPATTEVVLCEPGSTTLSATASPNTDVNWYSDANLTTLVYTGTTFNTPYLAYNTTFYVQGVLQGQACKSDSIPVHVRLNGSPHVDLGTNKSICVDHGHKEFLNARNAGSDYLWDNGYNGQVRVVDQSGKYWVTVTNVLGCLSSDTIVVDFKWKPQVELGNDTTVCNGTGIALHAGSGAAAYIWSTGETTADIVTRTPGTYKVVVTGHNGCISTDSVQITHQGMAPQHEGIWVKNLGNMNFRFQLHNPSYVTSYAWDFGDGSPLSYLTSPTHTFPAAGNYTIRLISQSECGSSNDTTTIHILPTGISETVLADDINIYPNPAREKVFIESVRDARIEQITVSNTLGQAAGTYTFSGTRTCTIDISQLSDGMYFLTIKTSQGTVTRPITIAP
ncbi:MAG: hypothetical protein BGO09_07530 [Bacteroidetes bacterium 47-18]|nr:MAG: hypothetical protein BGO09_07530 [Bacteroidetes bacterium 47-18]